MSRRLFAALVAAIGVSSVFACSSKTDDATTPDCGVKVDRFKELAVVEESVVTDKRSLNESDGAWSWRHSIEGVMPPGADKSKFILSWLDNWVTTTEVNGFKTDRESRVDEMNVRIVCPWLKQTPANNCTEDCKTCAARELDLGKAPFRLRAIINRLDLRTRPDSVATSPAGEARMVYGLTYGPGDDAASSYAAMTMIFEYALPDSLSPAGWAEAWHHLGTHAAFDESYMAELQQLTDRFTMPGVSPSRTNGTALARVRTNESALNWIWQLRQFQLDSSGDLRLALTENTPGEPLNGSQTLRDYITANADAIKKDEHVMPASMLAGSADQLVFRWTFPGMDESLRLAFARGTCNGCHTGENPAIDTAFHVSPYRKGIDKLSPFMNDPTNPNGDELGKREKLLSKEICDGQAAAPQPQP